MQHSGNFELGEPAKIAVALESLAVSLSFGAFVLLERLFVDGERQEVRAGEADVESEDQAHGATGRELPANNTRGISRKLVGTKRQIFSCFDIFLTSFLTHLHFRQIILLDHSCQLTGVQPAFITRNIQGSELIFAPRKKLGLMIPFIGFFCIPSKLTLPSCHCI